jgi:deazaflavin-dependent oxidoreductase (nitroreductase family)
MLLRHVDPHKRHSRAYNSVVWFGRSRAGQAWVRHIAPRIDPPLHRLSKGRYPFWGMLTAPLLSTGAKSGLPREVHLAYFHDGQDVILIASNYGDLRHPAWYHNLVAHPLCQFGDEVFEANPVTDPVEYSRLYALAEQVYAGYGDYRAKTAPAGRTIPILRLSPR